MSVCVSVYVSNVYSTIAVCLITLCGYFIFKYIYYDSQNSFNLSVDKPKLEVQFNMHSQLSIAVG